MAETENWVDTPVRDVGGELDELVDTVLEMYENYKERNGLVQKWMRPLQFYKGFHWHKFNANQGRIEERINPLGRVRVTVNRTMDMVRTYAAKLMRQKPAIFTIPGSPEERDYNASRCAQRFIDAIWLDQSIQRHLRQTATYIPLFGSAFLHVDWDEYKGDFKISAVTPFEITPDWDARSFDELRCLIHTRVIDKSKLAEWFPDGPMTRPRSTSESNVTTLFDAMIPPDVLGMTPSTASNRDRVKLHRYYERPCSEYPQGRRAVIAEGAIYEYGPNDLLPNFDLPFIMFNDVMVPDSFWGQGTAEDFVELNYSYNKLRSLMLESLYLYGWPKLMAPVGSPIAEQPYYGADPGQILTYNPGQEYKFLMPGQISGQASAETSLLIADMEAVSGQHETTRTSAPPGDVRAGIAIQQLLELDESRMAGTFAAWEEGIERLAKMLLEIAKNRYTENKSIAIVGKANKVEYYDFKGSDLLGNYDVRVQPGSSLPQSKTARQQLVLDMHQQGLLKDEELVMDLLDIGQMERYWDEHRLDETQAQAENRLLSQGVWVSPADYQDDDRHIKVHNLRRKSSEYLTYPEETQKLFSKHVNVHGLAKRMKAAIAAMPEAPAEETAPPEGAPPPEETPA